MLEKSLKTTLESIIISRQKIDNFQYSFSRFYKTGLVRLANVISIDLANNNNNNNKKYNQNFIA